MNERTEYDAVVVGAGPNGLAAAIMLARAGLSVLVLEAQGEIGGGTRSQELTLPGFVHDVCSAIHPFALNSPFFKIAPLEKLGVEWVYPPLALAHPFDNGHAATLERSLEATAQGFGDDAKNYLSLMRPLVADWDKMAADLLGPPRFPSHPLLMARFGFYAVRSIRNLARQYFSEVQTKSIFAGVAAHSMLPLDKSPTASFALVLFIQAHLTGWPLVRGGTKGIPRALERHLKSLGGEVMVDCPVKNLSDIPPAKAVLFDLTPRQILAIAGDTLAPGYRRALQRYRYGTGVFKIDWALDAPIPFKASECSRAGTVHLGGTIEEIAASEKTVWNGYHPERPFVLLSQQSLFDSSRAPEGRHTAWAYCHVPAGSTIDMAEKIEQQVERFAPGFKERILARHVMFPADMERHDANYIGGDINGGVQDWGQLFTRPVMSLSPYATPIEKYYICSSSTPPGGGVHGMCGYHAARAALKRTFGIETKS